MPFDPGLAARLEEQLASRPNTRETRMFGGFGYLLNGNMCVGIHGDRLIIRLGVEQADKILNEPSVGPMNLTGRNMKGWAMVQTEAIQEDADLQRYCQMAIDFVETLPPK